jgi:hypothetical protein
LAILANLAVVEVYGAGVVGDGSLNATADFHTLDMDGAGVSDFPNSGENSMTAGGGGRCRYEYTTHGGQPVVTSASCKISTKDLDKGTEPSSEEHTYVRKLGGHDDCNNDDAGHILANRLGGYAVPVNVFPQSPHLNRGLWEKFERFVYKCLTSEGASTAELSWTFSYSATAKWRPTTATYKASFNAGCSGKSQSFSNACSETELLV